MHVIIVNTFRFRFTDKNKNFDCFGLTFGATLYACPMPFLIQLFFEKFPREIRNSIEIFRKIIELLTRYKVAKHPLKRKYTKYFLLLFFLSKSIYLHTKFLIQ